MSDEAEATPPPPASAPLHAGSPVTDHADWPLRPWLLAGVLALCGYLIWLVGHDNGGTPVAAATITFLVVGGISFALSLEKLRALWSAGFAILSGAVIGGIAWHVARSRWDSQFEPDFAFASGVFALLIALPLFQAMRDKGHWKLSMADYPRTHFHVWIDAVIGASALAFTGIAWLLLFLLAALFQLIRVNFLMELVNEGWFVLMFSGAAFGAALGILRDNEKVLGTLFRVVMLVLSVLAPFFAFGLVIFLMALLLSGLSTLWAATDNATPILLASATGALVLTNAVIRNSDDEGSQSTILKTAALVLALTVLPLTVMAAISTGQRIGQYGLTPDRIWALIAVIVGVVYGTAPWIALLRGRIAGWADYLRQSNLHLAVAFCGLALFLALPILDFGAVSTRSQLTRLDSGKIKPDAFDWQALKFDFGPSGRAALQARFKSGPADQRLLAKKALDQDYREYNPVEIVETDEQKQQRRQQLEDNLRLIGGDDAIRKALIDSDVLDEQGGCYNPCIAVIGTPAADGSRTIDAMFNARGYGRSFLMDKDGYIKSRPFAEPYDESRGTDLTASDKVEIRTETQRRFYLNGKPVGDVFQ